MTNRIIINNNSKYQKKIKVRQKQELYNYLSSRNFNNYLKPIEETSKTETYRYIDDNISKEDKILTLSTCTNVGEGRTVLHAKLIYRK